MAKKTKQKTPERISHALEIRGLIAFSCAILMLLSLVSFSIHGNSAPNWLGAIGNTLGWSLTAFFGLGSYFVCLAVAWVGFRWLLNTSSQRPFLSGVFIFLAISSVCMLLSLFEESYVSLATSIRKYMYASVENRVTKYHLGGAPYYYLYHDLPKYNLLYILNGPGVALLFTTILATCLLLLTKISPLSLLMRFIKMFDVLRIQAQEPSLKQDRTPVPIFTQNDSEKEKEFKGSPLGAPVSDFMRYVKLRIPSGSQGQTSQAPTPTGEASSSTAEMLAINPEQNLKSRPSLSKKESSEKEDIPEPRKVKDVEKPLGVLPAVETTSPKQRKDAAIAAQKVFNGDFSSYKLPNGNLLTNAKKLDHSSLKKDLKRKAEVLEETLLSFGIEAKVGQINCGPTITSFEVQPAIGVKVQKIKTLENDIALNMEAKSIRIIAPIPGKAVVGIEVPNAQPEEVGFKEMLAYYQQCGKKFNIPVLLGKAVNGDYVMNDLTKMPHCIIAGATGSGKSVCINTIIMSILLNARPDEIKLVMVDPKKVELTPYTKLPHMLAPVITEPQGACAALMWLVKEMERRYEYLKQIGVRNIEAFNNRTVDKEFEATLGIEIPEKLPYIVGIIDELADLMMVSSSEIETPIARIAQMARAIGIHLILATQRPSREVITGLIKANFPTRISFKVSSRVNSQIVLDDNGAESLLGNGDMLFLPPGASHMVRAQGAYIRDEDINKVVAHICSQAPPRYIIESFDKMQLSEDDMADDENGADELYVQAKDIVMSTGNASTTFLQRKLKIGYARAASLMDMLEQKGIVSSQEGSKARKLLVGRAGSKEEDAAFDLE